MRPDWPGKAAAGSALVVSRMVGGHLWINRA